jgi:hypothetical protein
VREQVGGGCQRRGRNRGGGCGRGGLRRRRGRHGVARPEMGRVIGPRGWVLTFEAV